MSSALYYSSLRQDTTFRYGKKYKVFGSKQLVLSIFLVEARPWNFKGSIA